MDLVIFRCLNALTGHGSLLDGIIVFAAAYLQYVLGVALMIASLWPVRRVRMFIAALSAAAIARLVMKPVLLMFIHRTRPYVALDAVRNIVGPQTGEEYQSFPSGHVLFFFALATAVYRYDKRWGYVFFGGATLMSIARVIGGIHWPSDILIGALLGIIIGWYTVQWIPWFRRALANNTEK